MEFFIPIALIIAGGGLYEVFSAKEPEKEIHLPEKEFFNYPMDATYFEDSYILSVKVKEDIDGIVKTSNTFQTVINSPEPNFHYFNVPTSEYDENGEKEVEKFKLKSQINPNSNRTDVDFLYKVKLVEGYETDDVEEFKKSVQFADNFDVELYNETIKQYEDYFFEVNLERVNNNKFYHSPEQIQCSSDYCSILKENTLKAQNQ